MVIKFACPNGHPLSTTESRAGKPGKCPKCGAGFVVPVPAENTEQPEAEGMFSLASLGTGGGYSGEEGAASHDAGLLDFGNLGGLVGAGPAELELPSFSGEGTAGPSVSASPATTTASASTVSAPTASGGETSPAGAGMGKPAAGPLVEGGKEPSGEGGATLPAGHIVFLCPNGHKLNGPKKLEGKPGQCPHCNARFRIPVYEEPEIIQAPQVLGNDSELEEESPPAPELAEEEVMEEILDAEEFVEEVPSLEEEIIEFPHEAEIIEYPPSDDTLGEAPEIVPLVTSPASENNLSYVVTRLWRERLGALEVHLKNGDKIFPQYFSPELSQQEHGVFAVATEDGAYQVWVFAWEDVARVGLTKLKELPKGLFE